MLGEEESVTRFKKNFPSWTKSRYGMEKRHHVTTNNTRKRLWILDILPFSSEIDECNERRSGCSQICQNTPGSFVCRCRKGFAMMPNKRTCRGKTSQIMLNAATICYGKWQQNVANNWTNMSEHFQSLFWWQHISHYRRLSIDKLPTKSPLRSLNLIVISQVLGDT